LMAQLPDAARTKASGSSGVINQGATLLALELNESVCSRNVHLHNTASAHPQP
jgi:hypothetical protein